MKLLYFLLILPLISCAAGGPVTSGGMGQEIGGGVGSGNPPSGIQQAAPSMDEGVPGAMTDYELMLAMANCQPISCPAYKKPPFQWATTNESSEPSEPQTTCITFKLHAVYYPDEINNAAANRVIRMAEMSDNVFKDFATDSNGDAILTLSVGGSKEYDFWLEVDSTPSAEMTDSDPDNDPNWTACNSSPCQFPLPQYRQFLKSFDQSCNFLEPKIRKVIMQKIKFVPLNIR